MNIADGCFIYHDARGYHIRVTTTKAFDILNYKGTVFAGGGRFSAAGHYRPDRRDHPKLRSGALLDLRFITDGAEHGLDWTTNGGWQRGRGIRQIVGQVANLSHKRMLRPYITRRRLLRRFLFML